jgi:hypothetical protein
MKTAERLRKRSPGQRIVIDDLDDLSQFLIGTNVLVIVVAKALPQHSLPFYRQKVSFSARLPRGRVQFAGLGAICCSLPPVGNPIMEACGS